MISQRECLAAEGFLSRLVAACLTGHSRFFCCAQPGEINLVGSFNGIPEQEECTGFLLGERKSTEATLTR
jgi:hypothetical protein